MHPAVYFYLHTPQRWSDAQVRNTVVGKNVFGGHRLLTFNLGTTGRLREGQGKGKS